jgi:transposase
MPIPLRTDFDALDFRRAARRTKDGSQGRRLLALAAVYDGASRTEAAKIGGVALQIVRDWVLKFNGHGPDGLIDRKAPGHPSRLNEAHRVALVSVIESGPNPAVRGVVRWRIIDLCQRVWDVFGVSITKRTMSRELRALGYRKLSARPRHHAQVEGAVERLKTLPHRRGRDRARQGHRCRHYKGVARRRGSGRPEEQDHSAMGQARHPSCSASQPVHRVGLYLRRDLPSAWQGRCSGPTPVRHRCDGLAPGRDRDRRRTGRPWRAPGGPGGLAFVAPARRATQRHADPATCQVPRAKPGRERLAIHARQLALQPRVPHHTEIPAHCGEAWSKLVDQPWRIMSIGLCS